MDSKKNTWNKALLYIKSRIEETAFQTWFDSVKINSIDKKIKDLTFEEIKNIYEKKKKPIKVPTLCDVLEKIGHKTVFNIEVKDQGEISQKYVIGKVIELLKRHNLFDNIIISSFNAQILKESKKIDNRYKTAWIWSKKNYRFYNSWKKVLRHYGPDKIHINQSLLTKKIIDKVHKTNREIFAYTVNDKKTLRKLIEMKVDGVFTDSPTILDLSRGTNHQRT